MTFTMLSWGIFTVGLGFLFMRGAIFVNCGGFPIAWFMLAPCFTTSANFSSGTYLRLILVIRSVLVVFALMIFR